MEDKRLVFDTISEHFDKWRQKYSQELFDYIIKTCELDNTKSCLEIGPGTGQASDFAIKTGCDYTAIELGSNLAKVMNEKYGDYKNFKIIVDDFEKHSFEQNSFDLVYSAATIQWIQEDIAYKKCYEMLKSNGYLAMFRMIDDYRTSNPVLYQDIQEIYDKYFVVNIPYTCKFNYLNGENYGLKYVERKEFYGSRTYNADDYVEYNKTHAPHITIKEEYKDLFYNGIRDAVLKHGNEVKINSTYVLDLYKKEEQYK